MCMCSLLILAELPRLSEPGSHVHRDRRTKMRQMKGFNELCEQGDIDGESLVGTHALSGCAMSEPLDQLEYTHGCPRPERDPYKEEGGEG